MSIQDTIETLEAYGKLKSYVPRTRQPPRRRLYLAEPALKALNDPRSAVNILVGRGYIEAALTRWVSGGLVYGNKKRGLFLDRLDPPPLEVWEIRVHEPVVQARLLGRLPEPDTLVLANFYTRQMLGDKGSENWKYALRHCDELCTKLLGKHPLFTGATIHEYVTEKCDDFPI